MRSGMLIVWKLFNVDWVIKLSISTHVRLSLAENCLILHTVASTKMLVGLSKQFIVNCHGGYPRLEHTF